jgi:uncharacterized phage protein (TIGR02218 family)
VTAARVRPLAAVVTLLGYDLENALWLTLWKGRVVGVALQGAEATIDTEALVTATRRRGLRAHYQLLCRHALYDHRCTLDPDDFDYSGTVSVIDSLNVTIPGVNGAADGYYAGGYVLFESGDYRTITAHAGNVVTIYSLSPGLEVGHTAMVVAGCDHTQDTCRTKFSNLVNFGGFPWLPPKNSDPFTMAHHGLLNFPNPF